MWLQTRRGGGSERGKKDTNKLFKSVSCLQTALLHNVCYNVTENDIICYWNNKIQACGSNYYSPLIGLHHLASTINVTEWIACSHNLHHIPLINPAPILPPLSTQRKNQKLYHVIKCKIIWCAPSGWHLPFGPA